MVISNKNLIYKKEKNAFWKAINFIRPKITQNSKKPEHDEWTEFASCKHTCS